MRYEFFPPRLGDADMPLNHKPAQRHHRTHAIRFGLCQVLYRLRNSTLACYHGKILQFIGPLLPFVEHLLTNAVIPASFADPQSLNKDLSSGGIR